MKIAQLSKSDHFGGGASRVAGDLQFGLSKIGYASQHWASWSGGGYDYDNITPLYCRFERYIRRAHLLQKKVGLPEIIPFELPILLKNSIHKKFNILHFHDLSSAISIQTLSYLATKLPVVWTLHDCSPFTAGCLYPFTCEKFKTGCRSCPQIGEWPIDTKFDFTPFIYNIKKKFHYSNRVKLITPSKWMAKTAFSSGLLHEEPEVISNGVDHTVFTNHNKARLRKKYSLSNDKFYVLLSSGNFTDPRKGTIAALEAIRIAKNKNPKIDFHLLVVGVLDENGRRLLNNHQYTEFGYISEQKTLAEVYSMGDIFVFCSTADNQPLVVLETMSCGTPMVGYATGGIPEMVDHHRNGYLATPGDINAVADGVLHAYSNAVEWSTHGIKTVKQKYTMEHFLSNHINLYNRLLEQHLVQK